MDDDIPQEYVGKGSELRPDGTRINFLITPAGEREVIEVIEIISPSGGEDA